jgi:phosphoserine phosphatase
MKLAVFDFDSTLMDGETIDFLAKELGIEEKITKITQKAMSGELDFFESLTTRVKLLEGLSYNKAVDICKNLPLMNGAKQTVNILQSKGYKVICFSGGFTIGTSIAKQTLSLDADFSNNLHYKNNKLTGQVGGNMMFSSSKGDLIQKIQGILGINSSDTLVCGDGANDLSMFAYANTKIAFCAKDILKKKANIVIDEKDLTKILEYI